MTKTSTKIGLIILGVFFALPVFGACQGGWQKKADDLQIYDYKMVYNAGYVGTYLDFETAYDINGFAYLNATNTVYSLNVWPTTYQMTGTLKTAENGYHFWVFGTKTSGTDNYFRYKDSGGSSRYSSTASTTAIFAVAGSTIYARFWEGFSSSFSAPYSEINIDAPKISNKIYAIIYSDVDYSYINTEAELYDFLITLNSLPCTGGTSGSWGEEPETPSFTDQDFGLIGNYFRDVLVWLLKPQTATMQRFSELKTTMESKAPFAYFFTIKNSLNSLSSSSTPAFELQDSGVFDNDIFASMKTGLAWILWIMFAFWTVRKISAFNF